MVEYTESNYRFTNPIRYFKANDPIYYEVDNIPLKQLQENDLWLKDQLNSTTSKINSIRTEIDRSSFTELKPYCEGGDNIIKVKPGRFTARINDAYNLTPLQIITNLTGDDTINIAASSNYNTWSAKFANDATISNIINKFRQQTLLSDSLNMNGLVERAFTYPASIPDRISRFQSSSTPTIGNVNGDISVDQPPYPLIQAQLWTSTSALDSQNQPITKFTIRQYHNEIPTIGFASLGSTESEFIKKWRGVARTSIVDVPEELNIQIPRFDANDFYYINELNQRVVLDQATQRIDLLFIYSKPVDTSETTVAKFNSTGTPRTITRAELGIVRGAGVGVDFRTSNRVSKLLTQATVTNDGSLKILPHISDQIGANTGFKVSGVNIRGSFPSPDDLMNLTPLLDENLVSNHYALIGQSILPIAYIVVKKNATLSNGLNIISNSDIIDIRPFFRTTELSYNERAGIAAAVPAPSLANPIVTQAELDYEIRKVYSNLTGNSSNNPPPTGPRVVAAGVVQGGFYYGVEGAIARAIYLDGQGNVDTSSLKETIKSLYNYPKNISDQPDWDLARWCIVGTTNQAGEQPNDRINFYNFKTKRANLYAPDGLEQMNIGALESKPSSINNWVNTQVIRRFGTDSLIDGDLDIGGSTNLNPPHLTDGIVNFYFVKKTIKLTNLAQAGIASYDVNVQLLNCVPLSCRTIDQDQDQSAAIQGVWVEKHKQSTTSNDNYFTIYVGWVSTDIRTRGGNTSVGERDAGTTYGALRTPVYPLTPENNRDGNYFAGFAVINNKVSFERNNPFSNSPNPQAEVEVGAAIYPTVQFQVIGYPSNWSGFNANNPAADFNRTDQIPVISVV